MPLISFAQIEYTGISKLIPPSQDLNIEINNICNNCLIYQINTLPLYDSLNDINEYQNNMFESPAMLSWKSQYIFNETDFIIDPNNLNNIIWPLQ